MVPVCLDPRTRLTRGIGDPFLGPFTLPPLQGVPVNPGVALEIKAVFVPLEAAGDTFGPRPP